MLFWSYSWTCFCPCPHVSSLFSSPASCPAFIRVGGDGKRWWNVTLLMKFVPFISASECQHRPNHPSPTPVNYCSYLWADLNHLPFFLFLLIKRSLFPMTIQSSIAWTGWCMLCMLVFLNSIYLHSNQAWSQLLNIKLHHNKRFLIWINIFGFSN